MYNEKAPLYPYLSIPIYFISGLRIRFREKSSNPPASGKKWYFYHSCHRSFTVSPIKKFASNLSRASALPRIDGTSFESAIATGASNSKLLILTFIWRMEILSPFQHTRIFSFVRHAIAISFPGFCSRISKYFSFGFRPSQTTFPLTFMTYPNLSSISNHRFYFYLFYLNTFRFLNVPSAHLCNFWVAALWDNINIVFSKIKRQNCKK